MDWNTFNQAFRDAERTIGIADDHVASMARIVRGRLRKGVSAQTLTDLKRELSKWNMHTKEWME